MKLENVHYKDNTFERTYVDIYLSKDCLYIIFLLASPLYHYITLYCQMCEEKYVGKIL